MNHGEQLDAEIKALEDHNDELIRQNKDLRQRLDTQIALNIQLMLKEQKGIAV